MNTKLPEDFKAQWVAALRSGKYKQGKFSLWTSQDNTFCCLGVAGCVTGVPLKDMDGKTSYGQDIYKKVTPTPLSDGDFEVLIRMNDGDQLHGRKPNTFSEIADYIEENL